MANHKSLYLIIVLILAPGVVTAHGGGITFKYGNGGFYGNYPKPHRNYYYPSHNYITGPMTSFSRAYGPVPSFGLRNYYGNHSSDLYYRRYSYDENFNSYLRNRAFREQYRNSNRNRFGYTYGGKSGKQDFVRGYRDGYKDAKRSGPGVFFYGGSD